MPVILAQLWRKALLRNSHNLWAANNITIEQRLAELEQRVVNAEKRASDAEAQIRSLKQ
ncbi:carbohydrate porin, partial [Salmonella enterica subsp. enterica serovar Kentucky]|nr:carbohydrate porin [Salmonella enterica subsp. enterica serovar Kentucky]